MVGDVFFWIFLTFVVFAIYRQAHHGHKPKPCKECAGLGRIYDLNGKATSRCRACRGSGHA